MSPLLPRRRPSVVLLLTLFLAPSLPARDCYDSQGWTWFHRRSCMPSYYNAVIEIPDFEDALKRQIDPKARDCMGQTALHIACGAYDFYSLGCPSPPLRHDFDDYLLEQQEHFMKLLRHGVNPNVQDESGRTALHYAAMWANLEKILPLLRHGASMQVRDEAGDTPLDTLLRQVRQGWPRYFATVALLVSRGARIRDAEGSPARALALASGTKLLGYGGDREVDPRLSELLRAYLEVEGSGAGIPEESGPGWIRVAGTPERPALTLPRRYAVHLAIGFQDADLLEAVLDQGADPNLPWGEDRPLEVALGGPDSRVVDLLVGAGGQLSCGEKGLAPWIRQQFGTVALSWPEPTVYPADTRRLEQVLRAGCAQPTCTDFAALLQASRKQVRELSAPEASEYGEDLQIDHSELDALLKAEQPQAPWWGGKPPGAARARLRLVAPRGVRVAYGEEHLPVARVRCPLELELPPGTHRFHFDPAEVRGFGWLPTTREIRLEAGETRELAVELKKGGTGQLSLRVIPYDVEVRLDGKPLALTPKGALAAEAVPSGRHILVVRRVGYRRERQVLFLSPGSRITREVRLRQAAPVPEDFDARLRRLVELGPAAVGRVQRYDPKLLAPLARAAGDFGKLDVVARALEAGLSPAELSADIRKAVDARERALDARRGELEVAVAAADPTAVARLLGAGHSPNQVTTRGESLLHLVAGRAGESLDPDQEARRARILHALVTAGADLESRDPMGNTPLHRVLATSPGMSLLLSTLVAAGADLQAKDGVQRTPLDGATRREDVEQVVFLCAAGADADGAGWAGPLRELEGLPSAPAAPETSRSAPFSGPAHADARRRMVVETLLQYGARPLQVKGVRRPVEIEVGRTPLDLEALAAALQGPGGAVHDLPARLGSPPLVVRGPLALHHAVLLQEPELVRAVLAAPDPRARRRWEDLTALELWLATGRPCRPGSPKVAEALVASGQRLYCAFPRNRRAWELLSGSCASLPELPARAACAGSSSHSP